MRGLQWFSVGFALLISALVGIIFYVGYRRELSYVPKGKRPLYPPRNLSVVVHLLVLTALVCSNTQTQMFRICGIVMPVLGIYYGALLLLRPVYRKKLRAESCAYLWMLVWTVLLLRCCFFGYQIEPSLFLSLPFAYPEKRVLRWVIGIWLAGFVGVMLWSILSHICYRRWVLKDAKLLQEGPAVESYHRQRRIINFPEYATLRVSKKINSPVSIGLFWKTTCVILPEKQYTAEELDLIFHHELVHICRRDSFTKLQMTLYVALMWFNPLAWLAMRSCANDLELSCDEAVLVGHQAQERRKYAELLLQTAACARGFTSCLSSSAKALRYRLKSVVKPGKRIAGSILVVLLSFVLMLSFTHLGIRLQPDQAEHLIFKNQDLSRYGVGDVIIATSSDKALGGECVKDRELLEYISSLSLRWSSGPYDIYGEEHIQIVAGSEEKSFVFAFGKKHLRVLTTTHKDNRDTHNTEYYEIVSEQDWEFIQSCIGQINEHNRLK